MTELEIPQTIIHNERIEHVGADVKGIVRLDALKQRRVPVLDDFSRQQHPTGLAADESSADHAVMDFKIVLGLKLLHDHVPHPYIAREHDVTHAVTLAPYIQTRFIFDAGGVEEALPAVHALAVFEPLCVVQAAIKAAELHAFRDGIKAAVPKIAAVGLGQMRKRPLPDLFCPEKELVPSSGENVQKELCGVRDNVDRVIGMSAAQHRKIRDSIQREQEGTGQMKEVSHHEISCPCLLQLGETVEDVEGVAPFLFDQIVNVDGEGFKEMGERDMHLTHTGHGGQDGIVSGKTDVKHVPPVADGLFGKGSGKDAKLVQS